MHCMHKPVSDCLDLLLKTCFLGQTLLLSIVVWTTNKMLYLNGGLRRKIENVKKCYNVKLLIVLTNTCSLQLHVHVGLQ